VVLAALVTMQCLETGGAFSQRGLAGSLRLQRQQQQQQQQQQQHHSQQPESQQLPPAQRRRQQLLSPSWLQRRSSSSGGLTVLSAEGGEGFGYSSGGGGTTMTAAEEEGEGGGGGPAKPLSDQWEVDCYSRPVVVGGKKLWELLITDATGQFRHVAPIPANKVNSREVRAIVASVIEDAPVRPKQIRFFRRAMFNMLNIALKDVAPNVALKPSRSTYALYSWLDEREAEVYPKMKGYKPAAAAGGNFLDINTPQKLPDAMRADQFAFVSLPLSEVMAGGDIDDENIGAGKLCPVPAGLDPDAMLSGVLFITKRAENLAMWLAGSELSHLKADLKRRELVMEVRMTRKERKKELHFYRQTRFLCTFFITSPTYFSSFYFYVCLTYDRWGSRRGT
jgi:hypothetical protein